jgi:hypothetical protein
MSPSINIRHVASSSVKFRKVVTFLWWFTLFYFEGEVLAGNGVWQEWQIMNECNHSLICAYAPPQASMLITFFLLFR